MTPESIGNSIIKDKLTGPDPVMIARIGKAEMDCLVYRQANYWLESILFQAWNNAGVFPRGDTDVLRRFCDLYMSCISSADVMATWLGGVEPKIIATYGKNPIQVPLRSLEPYYHVNPWSAVLEGKKVLVVHPFVDSIKMQFEKRHELFSDQTVLPDFELKTLRAVQSNAGNKVPYKDWFEALYWMTNEIHNLEFDIAIIGAGAYGIPLAQVVKQKGKKAIQMAGATQILFGIKGKRWDDHEVISKLYNENWVRPLPSETPTGATAVEGGCYW